MIKVAVTGGIGSGKTTVCKIFEKQFGIPVYYADTRAKYLMNHSRPLKKQIKSLLGNEAYYRNGRLNRKHVASIVFSNKELLEKLNKLVHPAIYQDADQWFAEQSQSSIPYAIKESALLYESKGDKYVDKVIVVHCADEERIKRVMKRDGSTKKEVVNRMNKQLAQEIKIKMADYLIDNFERSLVEEQINKIHQKLISLERK